ncbi:MAG: NAD-dependent deacylase [Chloroflexota bacterium]|nr:NAD-dependent deacylase [Chloroflexota bacterium]
MKIDPEQKMQDDIDRAVELLSHAKYVVALTGAGVSVESGIRPYRGPDGLWTEYGEPPMNRYDSTFRDPKKGWEMIMSGEIFSSEMMSKAAEAFRNAAPNSGHYALAELEDMGILKCLITQNVDNLHRVAGSKNLAEIHGNLYLMRCMQCNNRYGFMEISLEVLPPTCPKCGGAVKPDGVMFGEPIPSDVLTKCQEETSKCDCMLTVGTTGLVYPSAGFPRMVKSRGGTLIEVDVRDTEITPSCNVSIRGKSGEIMSLIVSRIKLKI